MAWIVQSMLEGPLWISDIGVVLHKDQVRDLDMLHRDVAEKSNDVKMLLNSKALKEIRKDPDPRGGVDPKVLTQLNEAAAVIKAQAENISKLREELSGQKEQTQKVIDRTEMILAEVRGFAKGRSTGVSEAEQKEASSESEREMRTHDRILALKDKKLEKNYKDIGNTVSKSADDVKGVLEDLDQLNF